MARRKPIDSLIGRILEDEIELSLAELCRACGVHAEWVMTLVEEGVLEPRGRSIKQWRFSGGSLQRLQVVIRLQRDLGINLSGAALALQLLEENRALRKRLLMLERRGPSE